MPEDPALSVCLGCVQGGCHALLRQTCPELLQRVFCVSVGDRLIHRLFNQIEKTLCSVNEVAIEVICLQFCIVDKVRFHPCLQLILSQSINLF